MKDAIHKPETGLTYELNGDYYVLPERTSQKKHLSVLGDNGIYPISKSTGREHTVICCGTARCTATLQRSTCEQRTCTNGSSRS